MKTLESFAKEVVNQLLNVNHYHLVNLSIKNNGVTTTYICDDEVLTESINVLVALSDYYSFKTDELGWDGVYITITTDSGNKDQVFNRNNIVKLFNQLVDKSNSSTKPIIDALLGGSIRKYIHDLSNPVKPADMLDDLLGKYLNVGSIVINHVALKTHLTEASCSSSLPYYITKENTTTLNTSIISTLPKEERYKNLPDIFSAFVLHVTDMDNIILKVNDVCVKVFTVEEFVQFTNKLK